jgi:hypothetical protein
MAPNAQYNLARPGSLPVRIAAHQRRKMYEAFLAATGVAPGDTVLDVGATSDRSYDHSNYLEAWYPQKARLTAVGIDDAAFIETAYPGVRFVRADGHRLPFADASFDVVHSSAVLEHAGGGPDQELFLAELWRVARKAVFVTTPNRWFPVEFHTVLPLLHWLPVGLHRRILAAIGHDFFAREENLNLLTPRRLEAAARAAGIAAPCIATVGLAGWPTNLLLVATKRSAMLRAA